MADDEVTGGGLRAQLEAALAENREMKGRLDSYEAINRTSTVRNILADKGAKAGSEAFYPANADVSEKAIEQWLESNAALFKEAELAQVPQTTDALRSLPNPNDPRVLAQRQLLAANDLSNAPRSAGDLSEISERLARASTRQELNQVYADYSFVNTTTA